jgi:hypothetical protein
MKSKALSNEKSSTASNIDVYSNKMMLCMS